MTRIGRIVSGIGLCILMCSTLGCSTIKVSGRVIPGAISYIGVVSESDERLSNAGIGSATIVLEPAEGSEKSGTIARGTSAPDGRFTLRVSKDAWPTDRVVVRSIADDYRTARGSIFLPRHDQRLLILMERTAGD